MNAVQDVARKAGPSAGVRVARYGNVYPACVWRSILWASLRFKSPETWPEKVTLLQGLPAATSETEVPQGIWIRRLVSERLWPISTRSICPCWSESGPCSAHLPSFGGGRLPTGPHGSGLLQCPWSALCRARHPTQRESQLRLSDAHAVPRTIQQTRTLPVPWSPKQINLSATQRITRTLVVDNT